MSIFVNKKGIKVDDARLANGSVFFTYKGKTKELKEKTFKNQFVDLESEKGEEWAANYVEPTKKSAKPAVDYTDVIDAIVKSSDYTLTKRGTEKHALVFELNGTTYEYVSYIKPSHDGFARTTFGIYGQKPDPAYNNIGIKNVVLALSGFNPETASEAGPEVIEVVGALLSVRRSSVTANKESFTKEDIQQAKDAYAAASDARKQEAIARKAASKAKIKELAEKHVGED